MKRPDPDRDGLTPVDYGPGFTQREELDILWLTDPRRNSPSRQECEADAREEPAPEADHDE